MRYIEALRPFGVDEFTFKHTYVAYEGSVFRGSAEDSWAREHQVEFDPFGGEGEVVGGLPWGPRVRRIGGVQLCYYHEPTPAWEQSNRIVPVERTCCRTARSMPPWRIGRACLYRLGGS